MTYEGLWRKMTKRMGYMVDLDHPYITLDNNFIESGWWILKKFFDAGMIYEGHKILPYCPRCGTGLASHEVAQGYKMVKTNTVTAKFKKKGADNEYFLAWTTTPWTLASNVALAVGPDIDYIRAEKDGQYIRILQRLLRISTSARVSTTVLEEMKGTALEHTGIRTAHAVHPDTCRQESVLRHSSMITLTLLKVRVSFIPLLPSVKTTIRCGTQIRSSGTQSGRRRRKVYRHSMEGPLCNGRRP